MQNGFSRAIRFAAILLSACGTPAKMNYSVSSNGVIHAKTRTDTLLENLLARHPVDFKNILDNRDSFNVQVIYTQIDRDSKNRPSFRDFYLNVNASRYFYPASTVKMPVALLSLERLDQLKGKGVTYNSTIITESDYSGQTSTFNDPTTRDGRPTIEHYIKKIFLVSDNEAFNRLYEFLGQEYINKRLHRKGYKEAEILHRLSISLTEDENRHTNPVRFFDSSGRELYKQPMKFSRKPFFDRNEFLGLGYFEGAELKDTPMNFSQKNRMSLESLHFVLRSIMFPNSVPSRSRFRIPADEYPMVWKYMSELPHESGYPSIDTSQYHDASNKFLLFGAEKGKKISPAIRIFNKIGGAYGFLIDVAYIVDFDKKIEFMLSAVIYCNSDEIVNDDKYDYDTIGFPFMKNLGELIYEYETRRKKKYQPDLSGFSLKYD